MQPFGSPHGLQLCPGQARVGYGQSLLDECVTVVHDHGLVKVVGSTLTEPENLEGGHVRVQHSTVALLDAEQ